MVSRARRCLSSPLPTAIVFANKKEGFSVKKEINMHIMLVSDTLNQSFVWKSPNIKKWDFSQELPNFDISLTKFAKKHTLV